MPRASAGSAIAATRPMIERTQTASISVNPSARLMAVYFAALEIRVAPPALSAPADP